MHFYVLSPPPPHGTGLTKHLTGNIVPVADELL